MTTPTDNGDALDVVETEVDRVNTKLGVVYTLVQAMPQGSLVTAPGGTSGGGTTTPTGPAVPAVPASLTGSVGSDKRVTMNWPAATDATSWEVHELLVDPTNTLKATVTTPTTVRGPLNGGNYRYGVVAVNANGKSAMITADVFVNAAGGGTFSGSSSGGGTTAPVTTQLGNTTDSASTSASSGDKTSVSKFTATASGKVTAGHARMFVDTGTAQVKLCIYADSSGVPGAKLSESAVLTLSATVETQQDFTFTGANQVDIVTGTAYWIGPSWPDPGTNNVNISRGGTASSRAEVSAYAPAAFGTATLNAGPVDTWVDVTSGGGTSTPTTTFPGSLFNISYWYITLPVANPTDASDTGPWDVYQPALNTFRNDEYFYADSDANGPCIVYYAPALGVTTSSASGATRTELREMDTTSGTSPKSAWSWTDGRLHSLTVTLSCDATSVVGRKECIVGQVHGASGTPPLYLTVNQNTAPGKLTIFKNGPSFADVLTSSLAGNTVFTYRLVKTTGNRLQLSYCLGTAASLPATPQYDWPGSDFTTDTTGLYFKAGAYNKQDISTASTGGSLVRHYRFDHVHNS